MKLQKGKNLNFLIAAIFTLILALFVIFSMHGIIKVYKLKNEETKVDKQIASLKKSNEKISSKIYQLKHNKQYIAELAREELGMIKKGEIVFKFINNKKEKK
jgi:cell division protein FtsB